MSHPVFFLGFTKVFLTKITIIPVPQGASQVGSRIASTLRSDNRKGCRAEGDGSGSGHQVRVFLYFEMITHNLCRINEMRYLTQDVSSSISFS